MLPSSYWTTSRRASSSGRYPSPQSGRGSKEVRHGEQTWDEMMIGWFTFAEMPKEQGAEAEVKTGAARGSD